MTATGFTVDFTADPAIFLAAAEPHLAVDPVLSTVVSSVTHRAVAEVERGALAPAYPRWWAVVRDGSGGVAGVAMRTAPFAPHPLFVLPMPDEAAPSLARSLHARGEDVGGVNGALPAARIVADETARLVGGATSVHEHTRLFELGDLLPPAPVPGRLRQAEEADADLSLAWFQAFDRAAAEQAGRPDPGGSMGYLDEDGIRARIAAGLVWLWEDESGVPVHLTGFNPPSFGVARVGPVYTPAGHRGRGFASAAVAEVSRRLLQDGCRVCLFTDQANPTSNKIYQAIGFRPVVDMANLLVTVPPHRASRFGGAPGAALDSGGDD